MIGMAKRSLQRELAGGKLLDLLQLQALLHKVAAILNARPLTARSFALDDFMAITPRDLLLGRRPSPLACMERGEPTEEEACRSLDSRAREVEERVEAFWVKFYQDVFPFMAGRRAWQLEHRQVEAGTLS